eukprot:g4432.t1
MANCICPLLVVLLLPFAAGTSSPVPPRRALIRGRQLHGYLLSLAKAGSTPVTNVQRPKAGGALDTKIPGTNFDLTTCQQGGTPAADLTQPVPATQTYSPGETITVAWETTIPHQNPPGVRIAVRYVNNPGDTFANHILAEGLQAGQQGGSQTVTLPNIQGRAELMWSWSSTADNGYYVSCADIQIGASSTGNNAGNNQNANPTVSGLSPSGSDGLIDEAASTAVIVIGIMVIVGVILCVGYNYVNLNRSSAPPLGRGGGNSGGATKSLPRPASKRPKSVAKGLRGTPASGLPAGWAAAVDGDGDTYYYTKDGRTSWELPTSPA